MKKFIMIMMLMVMVVGITGCGQVKPGNVGVLVNMWGGEKGVGTEELPVGIHLIGPGKALYQFPTFTQNYVWTADKAEGSPNDESITFQTEEGLTVMADVGISYRIDPEKVGTVFQKYRRGVEEITDVFLRNMVRDAFNTVASTKKVEYVYGKGKSELIDNVEKIVQGQVGDIGIIIEKVYIIGSLRLPAPVLKALNNKIEATQKAQQSENELREAQAEAKKKIAQAEGAARVITLEASAQAEANGILAASITPTLIQYEMVKKWDGVVPKVQSGGSNLLLNISE